MEIGNYTSLSPLVYLFQAREITEILNFQTPKGKKYFMAFVTSEPVDKYQACF